MNIEYIASGLSHTRITNKLNSEPEHIEIVARGFRYNNDSNGHKFGILYNGHTESNFGETFQRYAPYVNSIHADSGGLQIVTQGLTVTSVMKRAVYLNQSKWADIGMCFDEIPIDTVTGSSGRNDVSNRFFKSEELEFFARKTGKNLREQIDLFLDEKSKCKPMLIAQGNCYDTYMKWVEYVVDEVGPDRVKHIGGVAMGAAALGTGVREDIFRAFMFKQLPIELSHSYLHVLGVGSIRRMVPYVNFINNGYYDCDISYDSTTHTSGISMGHYFSADGKMMSISRQYSKEYENIFSDILDIYPELSAETPDDFHVAMNTPPTEFTGDVLTYNKFRTGFFCKSINNFTKKLNGIIINPKEYRKACSDMDKTGLMYTAMANLTSVKNLEDWNRWEKDCGRFVKSVRVSDSKPSSFGDFL